MTPMDNAAHTPGPWAAFVVDTSIGHAHKIAPINACIYVDHRGSRQTDEKTLTAAANARLIAAAPDMLAVLQALLDAHWPLTETDDHEDPACAAARLVLRKVQGLTP